MDKPPWVTARFPPPGQGWDGAVRVGQLEHSSCGYRVFFLRNGLTAVSYTVCQHMPKASPARLGKLGPPTIRSMSREINKQEKLSTECLEVTYLKGKPGRDPVLQPVPASTYYEEKVLSGLLTSTEAVCGERRRRRAVSR